MDRQSEIKATMAALSTQFLHNPGQDDDTIVAKTEQCIAENFNHPSLGAPRFTPEEVAELQLAMVGRHGRGKLAKLVQADPGFFLGSAIMRAS